LINLPWKLISKFDEELFNVEHLASQLCLLSSNWKDCVRCSIVSLSIYNKKNEKKNNFLYLSFFYSVIPKDKNSPISSISFSLSPLSSLPSYHLSTHIHKKKSRDNHTRMHARTRDHRIGMADKTTTTTSYHRSLVSFSSLKCPHRRCSISHLSILCMHTHT